MKIKVKVAGAVQAVQLIKDNAKTWIVQLSDGNQIKRHKVKHSPR